jgi:hypothetical protein
MSTGETRVAPGFLARRIGSRRRPRETRWHSFDAVRQGKGSGGTAHVEEQSFGSVPTRETRGLEEGKRVAALAAVLGLALRQDSCGDVCVVRWGFLRKEKGSWRYRCVTERLELPEGG